jgi:glycosyltransferase involved in cell wall biosynthesis
MLYLYYETLRSTLKRAYIAVTNDLATDQRVMRVTSLLMGQGVAVTCFGRRLRNSPAVTGTGSSIRLFRLLFNKGPMFYACFNIRLFLTLLFVPEPALFISNDLDTLPACRLAARIRKVKLIYDSHEFFTQVPELIHRKRVQSVWKWIEHRIVPHLSYAVTVSYSIAEIYRRLHGTRFRVVRNVPALRTPPPEVPGKEDGKRVIIYQGALNVGRGLELMIDTMQYLEDTVFMIVGTGDIETDLKRMVEEKGLGGKVVFKGRLSPEELYPLTCSADLGISLEEDLGLNYRYALPNKIFDYVQCRIPVLCSALPEMAKVVEAYGIGVAARYREPERLAKIIRYMLCERSEGAWREALDRAAGELNWENESKEYLALLGECGI